MIKEATLQEARKVASLAQMLWPNHSLDEFIKEMEMLISDEHAVVFLAYQGKEAMGFVHSQLRFEYVEGTKSSPVGYLEGLYVKEPYRKYGYARKLVEKCEDWTRSKGCTEFASDCELDNTDSLEMHLRLGFDEVNRIICFRKSLKGSDKNDPLSR